MIDLLLIIGIIYLVGTHLGEKAGTVLTVIVVVSIVLAVCKAMADSDKAYGNWVDYWKRGGPRRK